MITSLKPNEIFVFGSNTAGRHGRGAALTAKQKFGAVYGVGEGLTGQCYAFPTLDKNLHQRTWKELYQSRDLLYDCCWDNSDKVFLLTEVGTGLAGYSKSDMASLFDTPWRKPANLLPYNDWIYLEDNDEKL